jgi:pyocin large subunit-like protein
MGKKAKFKKIRKIASQMPVIHPTIDVSGKDVLIAGIKEIKGKPVEANATYEIAQPTPINHNRRMKKLYNEYGVNGVRAYINSINQFINHAK